MSLPHTAKQVTSSLVFLTCVYPKLHLCFKLLLWQTAVSSGFSCLEQQARLLCRFARLGLLDSVHTYGFVSPNGFVTPNGLIHTLSCHTTCSCHAAISFCTHSIRQLQSFLTTYWVVQSCWLGSRTASCASRSRHQPARNKMLLAVLWLMILRSGRSKQQQVCATTRFQLQLLYCIELS